MGETLLRVINLCAMGGSRSLFDEIFLFSQAGD